MRSENAGLYGPLGTPKLLTLHWTAGNYNDTFDHYHFCVRGDGTVEQTLSIKYKGSHTWQRNSNNIGISMCCMADGFPPTKVQIERTARLVAELVGMFGISWDSVKDHRYYAKLDDYENLRWDIGDLFPQILSRAKDFRLQIINGEIPNSMKGKVS